MSKDKTIAAFRFGFGLPLPEPVPVHPNAMVIALDRDREIGQDLPQVTMDEVMGLMQLADDQLKQARRSEREDSIQARTAYRDTIAQIEAIALRGAQVHFARALDPIQGLRERLVWFWSDHFTTRARSRRDAALPAALIDEAIRPHVAGRFADMLKAVMQHPAMLVYLDQTSSVGPHSQVGQRRDKGLNENLARELLELHTLGTGFDQNDVTQMAELLSGLTFGKDGVHFDPRRHEPGIETVQGIDYAGDDLQSLLMALEDLAISPLTAQHLAQKLAVHFISPMPDPDLVAAIDMAWRSSGGDLLAVTTALLSHPASWEVTASKIRQPFGFIIASLRALGVTSADVLKMTPTEFRRRLLRPLTAMGQPWLAPAGPDGWPESASHWVTPQTMAARITWAMDMPQKLVKSLPEPEAFASTVLGAHLTEPLLQAIRRAETRSEAIGLILASPAFNRR